MSRVETEFQTVIESVVTTDSELVVALSGGLDSVALLNLSVRYAQQQGLACRAVHVHHGLSDNAEAWASSCQKWCEALETPLEVIKVTLDLSQGESIEQVARQARYQALTKWMTPRSILLTGQHGDDQLETFLLALKRGSGPKGLASMAAVSHFASGFKVRPLLGLSRCELESWACEHKLEWVEDESNHDQRFDRNFLRHSVTPTLKERWPKILQSTLRTATLCAEQESLLDELMSDKLNAAINEFGGLQIEPLISQSEVYRNRLLRMWLATQQELMPSQAQMQQLWHNVACAKVDANPELKLANGIVRRFQGALYWVAEYSDVSHWSQTLTINTPVQLPDELGELSLCDNRVDNSETRIGIQTLRVPSSGECYRVIFDPTGLSAHPESRQHSRKLKKLFQEYGVPSWQRRRIPIIVTEQRVVAVGELFVDRQFSGQALTLTWLKSSNLKQNS
ncbi:tRNA lysidine(34) synthetase TilS [Vibrio astriarenae]